MPGYSRIDKYREAGPLLVMGLNPATGEMERAQVIQCDGCGMLTTTLFSDWHDGLHDLLATLLERSALVADMGGVVPPVPAPDEGALAQAVAEERADRPITPRATKK